LACSFKGPTQFPGEHTAELVEISATGYTDTVIVPKEPSSFFFSVRSFLEELFSKEYYSSKVPIGVIGLVTPSSTREEESITSYSCFSLGWGLA
jgi:hypothetical protein